jgi:hypothetical protein
MATKEANPAVYAVLQILFSFIPRVSISELSALQIAKELH